MVRPVMIIAGAIPAILAALLAFSLIVQPDMPFLGADRQDSVQIEYTRYHLDDDGGPRQIEFLLIRKDGSLLYSTAHGTTPSVELPGRISDEVMRNMTALMRETGFMTIPSESFPIRDDITQYQKHAIRVSLDGMIHRLYWPEQNATDKFIAPIITRVESELDTIIQGLGK